MHNKNLYPFNDFNFDKTSSVDIIRWIAGRNVDPPDISTSRMLTVTVDTILTATTINAVDSLDVELGDISEYWSVSIKCFATTWVDDVIVRVGSSEDATWASGNTAYFDKDPGTVIVEHWGLSSALTTQGTCFPLVNTYGVPLPGPYGILRIRNDNASALVDLVILSVKCK